MKPTLMAPWSWAFQLPDLWEINFCCVNHSVYDILLWQPEQTSTGSFINLIILFGFKEVHQFQGSNLLTKKHDITLPWIVIKVCLKKKSWIILQKEGLIRSKQHSFGYVTACLLSHIQLLVTLWNIAHQAPLSMGFSRKEYWSGLPCLSPRDFLNPGVKAMSLMSPSPALAGRFFTTSATWEAPFYQQCIEFLNIEYWI